MPQVRLAVEFAQFTVERLEMVLTVALAHADGIRLVGKGPRPVVLDCGNAFRAWRTRHPHQDPS